ncbi:unnamed protein product [Mesocestoides corti]|uniref:Cytochrome P450 n=1 Tax=Mesocestoides corti TaxID=53468 RepID=A0A0R3UEF4_MESCO|nr:unnamed protein product [Mesocestoides corti]
MTRGKAFPASADYFVELLLRFSLDNQKGYLVRPFIPAGTEARFGMMLRITSPQSVSADLAKRIMARKASINWPILPAPPLVGARRAIRRQTGSVRWADPRDASCSASDTPGRHAAPPPLKL